MSIQAVAWVIENSKARLGARLVLISIANHADKDGTNAWPSVDTIASEAGMSARQVKRLLPDLVKIGELAIEKNAGRNGTNLYSIIPLNSSRYQEGDNMSPPEIEGGDKSGKEGVTNPVKNLHNMSPEPSLTVLEPINTDRLEVGDRYSEPTQQPPSKDISPDVEYIRAFDEALVEVYGEPFRRPWPTSTDMITASRWRNAGISPETVLAVGKAQQLKCQQRGRKPIQSLQAISQDVMATQLPQQPGQFKTPTLKELGFE